MWVRPFVSERRLRKRLSSQSWADWPSGHIHRGLKASFRKCKHRSWLNGKQFALDRQGERERRKNCANGEQICILIDASRAAHAHRSEMKKTFSDGAQLSINDWQNGQSVASPNWEERLTHTTNTPPLLQVLCVQSCKFVVIQMQKLKSFSVCAVCALQGLGESDLFSKTTDPVYAKRSRRQSVRTIKMNGFSSRKLPMFENNQSTWTQNGTIGCEQLSFLSWPRKWAKTVIIIVW